MLAGKTLASLAIVHRYTKVNPSKKSQCVKKCLHNSPIHE